MVINNFPEFCLFRITRFFLPSLIKRGWGRFFNKSPSIPLFQRGKLFVAKSLAIPFALQISVDPLPRPLGEGRGEGIKKPNLKCDD
ncbi:MAG: hypothetical protein CTY19_03375 [Methylomonas sp.]|nr:MAG: hypothetical protein CTY19_03375 [Methylomonas sp.]